ncbi:MFS transporter [Thalassobacillus devorans]|uniref:MFS transporter n=1 Tax=Thalassobacillus devorans TaxID=279813 RepID=A0ABQ1P0V3_9BACI|nr:MFS transporter [Thalassobacillus devorans]NIK28083.1 putative MFS family arabinose efflux permease [Thalassobacillus devorans]GGC88988.1 MFS transporter [Thalassobacillus devorans]
MKKDKKVYLTLLSTACFMFSIAGSRPLIPLFANNIGATNTDIGLIVAMFSFLPLFLSLPIGNIIDKIGPKSPLLYSIGLGGVGLICPYLSSNLSGIYISQVLTGISQMIFVIAMQTFTGRFEKREKRDFHIFIFSIGVAVGSFFGPLFSGILSQQKGYAFTFFILGILSLFSIILVLLLQIKGYSDKNIKGKDIDKTVLELLTQRNLRYAFLVSALVLIAKDMFIAYFPLLANEKGISNVLIGIIISINAGAGVLIRFVLPIIAQKWHQRKVISFSILAVAILYMTYPLLEHVTLFLVISFILGICLGIGQPLSISATISNLPSDQVGKGLGLRLCINKFAQVIMPAFLGVVANVGGITGVFYVIGIIIFAGSVKTGKEKE